MDPRRSSAPSRDYPPRDPYYVRRSSDAPPPSRAPPRPIPPSSMPSLSSGQGFYTVESLQGATVVPPAQLAPPPRIVPAEPYPLAERALERLDRRPRRILPDDRAFAPSPHLEREHPRIMGRELLPPQELPPPRNFGPLVRDGPRMRPHPPPFMPDPRMQRFHPGREPLVGRERGPSAWAPSREVDRSWADRRMDLARDRGRPTQRPRVKKQSKPVHQPKPTAPAAAVDKKSPSGKQKSAEGGPGWCSVCQINCFKADHLQIHLGGKRHKRQLEKLNGEPEVDGGDQVMKEAENTDSVDEAAKKIEDNEVAKEGEGAEQGEAADTAKGATAKKRALVVLRVTRKRRKSTVSANTLSANTQNSTVAVAEEKEGGVDESNEPAAGAAVKASGQMKEDGGANEGEHVTDVNAESAAVQ